VASIPIPGRRSLRPVKNRGGSFDKVVDQNCPPPYFLLSAVFFTGQSTPLTKLFPEGKEVQNGGENLSQKSVETAGS